MVDTLRSKWFLDPTRNTDAKARLFCLPFAGGAASMYWAIAKQLSPEVKVIPIELPGRAGRLREPPYETIEELVHDLVIEFQPAFDTPFAILGHSMGALIAFELARAIERVGTPNLRQIILGAFPAPERIGDRMKISDLPDNEFLANLKRRYGFKPPSESASYNAILSLMLPTMRADLAMIERYQYQRTEPLSLSVSGYVGQEDLAVSADMMSGWQTVTQKPFSVKEIAGDHYTALKRNSFEAYLRSEVSPRLVVS